MRLLITAFVMFVAANAAAQTHTPYRDPFLPNVQARQEEPLTEKEIEKLLAEKEKKCRGLLKEINRFFRRQTLKDVIRDNHNLALANGYITAYGLMQCEPDPLIQTLNHAPRLPDKSF